MERVLSPGPELATDHRPMAPPTRAQVTAPRLVEEALRERPAQPWWTCADELLPLGYHVLLLAALGALGVAPWRLALIAACAVLLQATAVARRRRAEVRVCVNTAWDQIAWFVVLGQGPYFLATGLAAAVTGGVHSPLLVTFLAAWVAAAAVLGDRLQTRLLLGATVLGVGLLAAAPPALTGPAPAGRAFAALAALGVAGVGALLAPVHAIIRRKRDQMVRQRTELAAEALARAESLEQIGAKLAHELKNPLTGVKALVQLGARNPAEAASRERLEVVEREVGRMQEILQNYLSFTRPLQELTPRRVALGSLVSDALVVLSARADEARVRLYARGEAVVDADPSRLREALLNLVANAIEATAPGGEVEVEIRPATHAAEIVIRDTGRGMGADVLRRLGTPFFTTRDDGTGLGVVLARSVVAQHGGVMRYESEPGRGTCVTLSLPRGCTGGRDARAPGG
jgi:signal transduction histidine kinase